MLEWDDAFEISWQRPKSKKVGMRCVFDDFFIWDVDVTLEPELRFSDADLDAGVVL